MDTPQRDWSAPDEPQPKRVIVYTHRLNKIGGVETFIHNFCKRLSPLIDVLFVYGDGDPEFLNIIGNYCDVERYDDKVFETDTLLLVSAWGKNPEKTIKASKYIQMIHADYTAYFKNWNFTYARGRKTSHHVAVGNHVGESFTKATGLPIDKVIVNLLDNTYTPAPKSDPEPGKLKFITATRYSREKGLDRMIQFAKLLNQSGVSWEWDVYGNIEQGLGLTYKNEFLSLGMVCHDVKRDVQIEVNKADYMVQLSDTEGMPYCVQESLQALTPVITTKYPSATELITEGQNGWLMNFDLSNFNVDKFKRIPKLETYQEKSSEQDWLNIL